MVRFFVGWRQVASCFLLLAGVSFIASAYSIVAVPLGREFQPSRMVLMLAMTVLSGGSALLSPFLGSLMDRVSLRALMTVGSLLVASGYAAMSFATSFNQILIIFAVFVAPANVLIGPVAATVLLSRWFVKRRGTAIGVAIAGIAMGSIVYPPIAQALLDAHEWREAFRLMGIVVLIGTLPAALLVVNDPADRAMHPDGLAQVAQTANVAAAIPRASARMIVADPSFWLAAMIFATVLSGMKGMITNLAPIAIDQGVLARDAALLISLYGGCGFVAKLGFAAFADRLSARALMFVGLAGFASGMVCLTQASAGYTMIALGVGLVGLFGGIMVPMQSLLVSRIFGPGVVGRAMGLVTTVLLVASLATPPLFGRIFDVTGSYSAIFVGLAVLGVAAMAMVPYVRLQPHTAISSVPDQPGL